VLKSLTYSHFIIQIYEPSVNEEIHKNPYIVKEKSTLCHGLKYVLCTSYPQTNGSIDKPNIKKE